MEDRKIFDQKDFKYAYSSFGLRLLAYIIDMMVISAIFTIVKSFLPDEGSFGLEFFARLNTIISLGYFTITSLITGGQSLGKIITGIRVVSIDGDKLSASQILIREIAGRYMQNKFMVLYLFALFTPKKQSFIDLFVDTAVVKESAVHELYGYEF